MLVTLCGGVGAARMLSGLVRVVPPASITAVVNVGDDTVLHGLHISPDLDTITYTLAGMDNRETGWGVVGETWTVMDELARLGGESWFRLGDRDLATHLFRTERLGAGDSLTEVAASIAARRQIAVRLLPVTDDRVRTMLTLAEDSDFGPAGTEVAFQDYFVRLHHGVAVRAVRFAGADEARPTPDVVDALTMADQIVVCPSNPIVSIGPLLAVPGILAALSARRNEITAVSPIVAGAALKGPADRLMAELGTEPTVVGVARLYASWVGTLVIDEADRPSAAAVEAEGVRCVIAPTVMDSPERAAALALVVTGLRAEGIALIPLTGIGEIEPGFDLTLMVTGALAPVYANGPELHEGDVLVITQKVVSKAEGRLVNIDPDDPEAKTALVEQESVRIVRRRGDLIISETRHGFICANAGIDLSNVALGTAALLPEDADRSARRIRAGLRAHFGLNVGVIISDTFGRTWRRGVTDVAIGCAGVAAVIDLRGTLDANGRELVATELCVADELASAAELVMGKDRGIPAAIVRGVPQDWLRRASVHAEIVRPPEEDLFR